MKVPLSWLKDYVDITISAQELADKLTFSGVEVEGIETVGSDYAGMVVGEILSVEPHPGADRLRICLVNDGAETLRVVCGADNVAAGQKVPLARVGVTLPGGMAIRKAKIRGEESFGMLCAEDELGISADHAGVMILPRDVEAGTPLAEVLGPPDTVLHLEITWNRADCLSMIGIAREIAALTGAELRVPSVEYAEAGAPVEESVSVRIDDEVGCPRYTARVLRDVTIGPSPFWMQRRLMLAGVRAISNAVDVTNYVMLETGQPLHAFDYTLLEDGKIVVRRAAAGETMETLDDVSRTLTPDMLVIADAHRPVALAGIMGGAGSEIRDTTRTILLESAAFEPAMIHATSTALGLRSESSHRFERGVDRINVDWAGRRAAALLVELCGAQAACGVVDCFPGREAPRTVCCRYARVRGMTGVDIPVADILRTFEALGLDVSEQSDEYCVVTVPSFRGDLRIEADLVEEIARMHGMADIPAAVPFARVVPDADDRPTRERMALRHGLAALGLSEVVNYSFVSQALLDRFGRGDAARRLVLPNPVSADHAVMRSALLPQMVETLGRNMFRQVHQAAFYELGKTFAVDADGAACEAEHLCIALMGPVGRQGVGTRGPVKAGEIFLWLKGILEAAVRAGYIRPFVLEPAACEAYEEGWGFAMRMDGTIVGYMGLISKEIRNEWRMHEPVAAAELEWTGSGHSGARVALRPLPTYPAVTRDIAFVAAKSVTHEKVLEVVREVAPPELTGVELFDIYEDQRMGEEKRSMAYSLTYRSAERTLTDDETNAFQRAVREALRERLNVELREE